MRFGLFMPLVAIGSLAASAPAPAAVNCNFAAATAAIVGRDNSQPDNIQVNGSQCGSATVATADTITFTDGSGSNTKLTVFLGNGPFAPGLTDESGGSDEIELTADFASGGNEFDVLEIHGCATAPCSSANDHVVWGSGGVNLNASEAPTVDADMTATGVESYHARAARQRHAGGRRRLRHRDRLPRPGLPGRLRGHGLPHRRH